MALPHLHHQQNPPHSCFPKLQSSANEKTSIPHGGDGDGVNAGPIIDGCLLSIGHGFTGVKQKG